MNKLEDVASHIGMSKHHFSRILILYMDLPFTFGKTMIASMKKSIFSLEFYDDSYDEVFNRLVLTWKNSNFTLDNEHAQELIDRVISKSAAMGGYR